MAASVSREKAEAIVATISAFSAWANISAGSAEAERVAEELGVPVGIIWAGLDQQDPDAIDELTAWWPRKGA